MLSRIIKYTATALVLLLVAAQFVQPDRTNPPANPASSFAAVTKASPEVAGVFRRACGDCHSNETTWPWYSRVAPVSWMVADHVKEGRAHLNLSEWSFLSPEASALKLQEACREVKSGGMPLRQYTLMHPEARLSQADIDALCSAGTTSTAQGSR